MQNLNTEITIIGGGIAGTAIARRLSQYDINVILMEKESDVSFGASKASTAIIHPGIPIAGAPIKSKMILEGNLMFPKICEELDIPFKRTGEITLAMSKEELNALEDTKELGEKSGVKGLEIIKRDKILELEPYVNKKVIAGLWSPTAGIVYPFDVVMAMAENAIDNGVKFLFNESVLNINKEKSYFMVYSPSYVIKTKIIINTAGVFADEIAAMVGIDDFSIEPHRGEEIVLDKRVGYLLKHPIFPPEPWILAMPTVHGNIVLGTSYNKIYDREDTSVTSYNLRRIFDNARKMIPILSEKDIIRSFAGLRPMNTRTSDYIIEASEKVPNFINVVLGTPGITSSPAVAEEVLRILNDLGVKLVAKSNYNPYRKGIFRFNESPDSEKIRKYKEDKKYGHVVCRCETVTEGEIIEAIRRGARTLDGVKYRTRAGMGRCQGGFCSPRVIKILARELNIPVTEVTKKGGNSRILLYKSKELLRNGGKNEHTES